MWTDSDSFIFYDPTRGGTPASKLFLPKPKELEGLSHMALTKLAKGNDIVPAKSVIGSNVVNANYQDLGTIEDLVLDAGAGRIAYAVLSFGGFLGVGDKYFAIPWYAFQFHLAEKRIVLNVDKKLLESAPGFDKANWPNMADSTWGTSIYKHYGLAPYWEETTGDRP
jgi:sporulation protein YlmC with PRC-barrel domain